MSHPRASPARAPHRDLSVTLALLLTLGCGESLTQISEADVSELRLSADAAQVGRGRTLQLRAYPLDETGALLVGTAIEWESLDASVASVDGVGLVTGVALGSTHIVGSVGGFADTAAVVVVAPPTMQVSTDSLGFQIAAGGGDPTPEGVSVTNGGVIELVGLSVDSIVYGPGAAGWLSADLDTSVAPATLTLTASTTGVTTAGQYRARVWLSALEADQSPTMIVVTLAVTAGSAATITVHEGDGQTGTAGAALVVAPAVVVRDVYGNAVAGVEVTFAVAGGGGSVTGAVATTDASGVARAGSWTLGGAAGTSNNTLTAQAAGTGIGGNPVTFTASASAGSAATVSISAGDGQVATVGTAVGVAPQVLVVDAFGNPVAGHSVTFAVTGGGGAVSPAASVQTSADGKVAAGWWTLGTVAGVGNNTLTALAQGAGIAGNPVTFTASATAGSAASIALHGGDGQSATVDTPVPVAPEVLVQDDFGNPVPGHPVTFSVAAGGGSLSPVGPIPTDQNGRAAISWTVGTVAGTDNNELSATAATAITGSPVGFTASATAGPAASIAVAAGAAQSATVATEVGVPPRVTVTDAFGNPVAGHEVTFAVTAGGGTVAPTGPVPTAADGSAAATSWTLGTSAGTGNNSLSATAAGAGVANNPAVFTASGMPGLQTQIVVSAGDQQTALAATDVPVRPAVSVLDAFGNGVPGVDVVFSVSSGGGSVAGASPTTDASGVATLGAWTLGATAGTNTLSVSATGIAASATVTATGISGQAQAMQLQAGDAQADTVGATLAVAYAVRIVDANGNGVEAVPVTWLAAGGGSIDSPTLTDAQGIATSVRVLGTTSGTQTATAAVGGLQGSPVQFTATAAPGEPTSLSIDGGDGQTATVGTQVAVAPRVLVTDQFGNPVPGHDVQFAVTAGSGSVAPGAAVPTASDGTATASSWTLGTVAGVANNALTATAAGGSVANNPVTFTASATADAAATISLVTGDGQSATVATAVAIAPRVLVQDQYGNPVAGHDVTFVVTSGAGASVDPATPVATDPDGTARASSWTLGTVAGTGNNTLSATAAGPGVSGNPVTFTASATAGSPAILEILAGDAQMATVNTTVAVAPLVRVTDAYTNPIAGHPVTFAVTAGGGSMPLPLQVQTAADGTATVASWRLGTTAGVSNNTASATAAGAGILGNPASFTATATADVAASISIAGGNNQSATVGTAVTIDPRVLVLDPYGNAVPGHAVTFAVTSGTNAQIDPITPIQTDANGIAAATSWTVGTAAGTSNNTATATAAGVGIGGNPVTFTASATAGPPASIAVVTGNNQTAITGTNVTTSPTVVVLDQYLNPISGRTVAFSASPSGSVGSAAVATNVSGQASTTWTVSAAGHALGANGTFQNTLTASVSGTALSTTFAGFARYSYATHVHPLWNQAPGSCTGCHYSGGGPPDGGIVFQGTAADVYAQLVDVTPYCDGTLNALYRRVSGGGGVAAADTYSILMRYLDPSLSDLVGNCGPHGGGERYAAGAPQLTIIRAWIRNGAPNN